MKGFLLSAFIVISFIAYAFMQRFGVGIQIPFFTQEKEPENTQVVTPSPIANVQVLQTSGKYKDGVYVGDSIDANYGNIQVKVTIANGKITDIQFLDYPHDRARSQTINTEATPILVSEAIAAQNADVDAVTGATFTSAAFIESLQSALDQAV